MAYTDALKERNELVLATSGKDGNPHAIVVISLGYMEQKILIGVCMMKKSLENIKENNNVCIIAKNNKEYYRIKGKATIYSSGEHLDLAISKSNPPLPKQAILVDIKEVFDLDKCKNIPI
jgi:uncharacterized pyridoxamine 5'-phosphate oxidase family protein